MTRYQPFVIQTIDMNGRIDFQTVHAEHLESLYRHMRGRAFQSIQVMGNLHNAYQIDHLIQFLQAMQNTLMQGGKSNYEWLTMRSPASKPDMGWDGWYVENPVLTDYQKKAELLTRMEPKPAVEKPVEQIQPPTPHVPEDPWAAIKRQVDDRLD
jgi:hypothetical protein